MGSDPASPAAPTTPRRRTPVTTALLVGLVVAFVASSGGAVDSAAVVAGAQINPLVRAGEWWRVVAATGLHANLTHLLFNGYALYLLGPELERRVGGAAFALLYLASGLAGGIAFLLAVPGGVAVGASGAIFGLFGAWFAASWVHRDTPAGRAMVSRFGVLLAINLALPLFIPGIAWQAHLGGLAAGVAIGGGWALAARRRASDAPVARAAARRALVPGALAAALLGMLLWYT